MPRVFLSFIHEDRRVADALKTLVEHELGIHKEVFMVTDQDHLRAGDNWLGTIENALKSSEIVLSLLSKRSITKPWVNFEAGAGWLAGKRVIPVCIGNQKKGVLPNPYSHWQGVNLPDDETFLLNTIADHLKVKRPSVWDKIAKVVDGKKDSPIDKVLEMTRDVRAALKDWKDEE